MASVFVSSDLLADAPRVAVRFEQEEGKQLKDIRRQFGLFDAELRELNCARHQATRTNPDYRVESGKEYELLIPGKSRGWSKDACRNASQLVAQTLNLPAECWDRPADLFNNSLSVLLLILSRTIRLVIAGWMFTLGLLSTGLTLPLQVLYHLFTVSIRVLAPSYSTLPPLRHTPQFMFIAVSCFLALLGSALAFVLLMLALVSQCFVCILELIVRSITSLIWVTVVCLGGAGISPRKRIDILFFAASLPWLNGVVFMSVEFASRFTFLLATYLLMISRHKISVLVAAHPAGSAAHRPTLIQYSLLWMFPALSLAMLHYVSHAGSLYICWILLFMSVMLPYLVNRDWSPF